jgi:thioesterase domain-containing protein
VREESGEKRLVGYVVAEAGEALSASGLRRALEQCLPEYMIPATFMFLDSLPLTPHGKVDRAALPKPSLTRSTKESSFVPPGNVLELQLVQIWEDLLNVRPIGITDNFFTLGGYSLLTVRLMARIKKLCGRIFPQLFTTLFQEGTIEQLAKILHEETESPAWSPIVPIQTHGSKHPFFCVHSVGGQVAGYYLLSRYLGIEYPFYGIQGRFLIEKDVREKVTPIEVLAAQYLEAVRAVQPEGPYLIGGYSFGGMVAYEMAVQLRRAGQEVALLAVFDTHSPSILRQLPEDNDAGLLVKIAWVRARQLDKELLLDIEEMERLEPDEQLKLFIREARKLDLLPAEAEMEFLRNFLKGMSARRKAIKIYEPQPYDGSLTVFQCEQADALVNQALEEAGLDTHDPALGWGDLISGPITIKVVTGHHDRMMVEPYVQGIAEALRASIDEAESSLLGHATVASEISA